MQRRTRITLAIVATTGALALGAGTAAADPISDLLGGADSNAPSSSHHGHHSASSDDNASSSDVKGEDGTDGADGNDGGADGVDGASHTKTNLAPSSDGHSDSDGDGSDSGSDN